MLNKKCLFGGGLYLVNTAVIVISISSDVIARESIHAFRSELNQISWGIQCAQREFQIRYYDYGKVFYDDDKHRWILDKYYEDSRTRVIGKAIGDCVANKGEFKGKKAADIITFENTLPELYEQKNWNAVILYNYVHEAINRNGIYENNDEYFYDMSNVSLVLQDKLETIKRHYENYYIECIKRKHIKKGDADNLIKSLQTNLSNAINDIQKYVDALKLNMYLVNFRWRKQEYEKFPCIGNLAPLLETSSGGGAVCYPNITLTDEEKHDIFYDFYPTIACADNQLYIVGLSHDSGRWKKFEGKMQYDINPCNSIKNLEELKFMSERLLERLGGVVKLPNEDLLKYWLEIEAKAKRKQYAQYWKMPENFNNWNMMDVIEEENEEQANDDENENENEEIEGFNPEYEEMIENEYANEEMIENDEGFNEEADNMEEAIEEVDEQLYDDANENENEQIEDENEYEEMVYEEQV